jgi:TMEM175 potassium channel family protein
MNTPKRISNKASPSLLQAKPEREMAFERLIFFSDAVFAIAITLLALDIRLPVLPPNATDAQVLHQLAALSPKYYSFGLSFLAIGLYWLGHHRMFHSIARFDPLLLLLNLWLLLCIAFIPFPASVIGDSTGRTASVFYALTLAITGLVSGGMWLYASAGGRLLASELDRSLLRLSLVRSFLAPTCFLLSAAMALWNPALARILWYLIALSGLIMALLTRGWFSQAG